MTIHLNVCGRTDRGRVREQNEDAFLVADLDDGVEPLDLASPSRQASRLAESAFEVGERGVLLSVSDGLGGHNAGEIASALVVEGLRRGMTEARLSSPSITRIESAVERANRAVLEGARAPGRDGMGATLTAAYAKGGELYLAEVGDSRAYLLRRGELAQVTRDQSYVQLLVERRQLTPEQAATIPLRNVVLQAMGQPSVCVEIGKIALRRDDLLLLCSDGLTTMVGEDEILAMLESAHSLDATADALVHLANAHGGGDNVTVVLARASGDLPEASPDESVVRALKTVRRYEPGEPCVPSSMRRRAARGR